MSDDLRSRSVLCKRLQSVGKNHNCDKVVCIFVCIYVLVCQRTKLEALKKEMELCFLT